MLNIGKHQPLSVNNKTTISISIVSHCSQKSDNLPLALFQDSLKPCSVWWETDYWKSLLEDCCLHRLLDQNDTERSCSRTVAIFSEFTYIYSVHILHNKEAHGFWCIFIIILNITNHSKLKTGLKRISEYSLR